MASISITPTTYETAQVVYDAGTGPRRYEEFAVYNPSGTETISLFVEPMHNRTATGATELTLPPSLANKISNPLGIQRILAWASSPGTTLVINPTKTR